MQARWGMHGNYESVAYAPWSCQEVFDLTVHCFNVADRYRLPVFLMADEVIGHMVERVVIPSEDKIPHWPRKLPKKRGKKPFKPFKVVDDDLVPPMVHAGEGYRIHFTGLTHDERGYPDMSAEAHHELVVRLTEKIRRNREHLILTESDQMQDAKIAVISYGSTARSAQRAVNDARHRGVAAGFLRLISLWPFPEELIKEIGEQVDAIVVAEMNLGQMIHEVERFVKKPVIGVHHAGGEMMQPQRILETILEVAQNE
jgi:2-oxoglutarate ferredoxin oxidoreductase subunit alpha